MSDELARRKALSFAQAEGAAPLPQQHQPRSITKQFRAEIWAIFHALLQSSDGYDGIGGPLAQALTRAHISHFHLMADDLDLRMFRYVNFIKPVFLSGDYIQLLGFLQFMARDHSVGAWFRPGLQNALENSRLGYRLIDNTLVPLASEDEVRAISQALSDAGASGFAGARAHLLGAGEQLTQGRWADSIRESVHAVEATARLIHPSKSLDNALTELERSHGIHPSLRKGFGAIYGYTSSERGIRHPLIDEPVAEVDEADALFMIGACASFVSYLIAKARAAGIKPA